VSPCFVDLSSHHHLDVPPHSSTAGMPYTVNQLPSQHHYLLLEWLNIINANPLLRLWKMDENKRGQKG